MKAVRTISLRVTFEKLNGINLALEVPTDGLEVVVSDYWHMPKPFPKLGIDSMFRKPGWQFYVMYDKIVVAVYAWMTNVARCA